MSHTARKSSFTHIVDREMCNVDANMEDTIPAEVN